MSSETGFDPNVYDRFPTKGPRPKGELKELAAVWCGPKGWQWISAINNNFVGVYYLGAAMLFFLLAGVLGLLIRAQLAAPLNELLSQGAYNQVFTVHGTTMMFLFAVPAVEALGMLLLPQMLGSRDLPFPRLSAYAFWAYLIGGLAFFASIFFGLAPDGGWFMYPPLSNEVYSPGINADFWLLGIGFIEISAIAGAIEIIVGVLRTRAPGMSLDKLPVFAWAMLIFAGMIVIAFPSVILATTLLELERALDWPFFDPTRGGDPLLWQHLFWFFGHPEVYIIFLPAAGATSAILPAVCKTRLVGHRLVVMAMLATGFISFGVWAHHMFTVGMPALSTSFFSAASTAVSVPAGLQVFAWIATVASAKSLKLNAAGLFALGGLLVFTMGGLTGVMVAIVPFDWQAHDTYFIVAHLHYVLIGGMVLPLFAAIYFWAPMVSSRALSERLGRWAFWLMFAGVHLAFLPMHLTGLMGMPRRVNTYLPGHGWEIPNLISTVGAFVVGAGALIWVIDMVRNFRPFGASAGTPEHGPGLEWLPAELYSLRSIPVVKSLYPIWDQPNLARDVKAGRYLLPGSATGGRETLVTSPLNAEPQHLLPMPNPSGWHVWAAVFTAGFFLLLTVQAYWASVTSGVLAVYCIISWCWMLDRPAAQKTVDVGGGLRLPTYVSGPSSTGWWAMSITVIVAGMILAMNVFSYIFLWSRSETAWRPPADPTTLWLVAGVLALGGALAWGTMRLVRANLRRGSAITALAALAAGGLLAAGWVVDFQSWWSAGLRPDASAHGAVVYSLLAWQGVFTAISAMMALYVGARWLAGHVRRDQPATVDLVALFLIYTAGQGLVSTLLPRLFPGG